MMVRLGQLVQQVWKVQLERLESELQARQEPRVLLEQMELQDQQELLARLAQMEQGLHITDKSPESQTAQYQSLLLGHINQLD
jgi:hypothetical protein